MPADDATFLRRVYTDVIGRLPSPAEAPAVPRYAVENKREFLIDELLERPEYVDHWANQWADLLRPNPYRVGIKAVLNYDNWIRQQFRDNLRYDEFVANWWRRKAVLGITAQRLCIATDVNPRR